MHKAEKRRSRASIWRWVVAVLIGAVLHFSLVWWSAVNVAGGFFAPNESSGNSVIQAIAAFLVIVLNFPLGWLGWFALVSQHNKLWLIPWLAANSLFWAGGFAAIVGLFIRLHRYRKSVVGSSLVKPYQKPVRRQFGMQEILAVLILVAIPLTMYAAGGWPRAVAFLVLGPFIGGSLGFYFDRFYGALVGTMVAWIILLAIITTLIK